MKSRTMRVGAGALALAATLAASALLAGCATPYASSGITGGYQQQRVNAQLTQVTFLGNGFTDAGQIQTFALYRCAELAREAHKPWFLIYDSLSHAARGQPAELPRVGTLGGKPAAIAFLALADESRPGAHETRHIIDTLKSTVDLGADVARSKR